MALTVAYIVVLGVHVNNTETRTTIAASLARERAEDLRARIARHLVGSLREKIEPTIAAIQREIEGPALPAAVPAGRPVSGVVIPRNVDRVTIEVVTVPAV